MDFFFKTKSSPEWPEGVIAVVDGVEFWCPLEFYTRAMSAPKPNTVTLPVALDEELAKALMLVDTLDEDEWYMAEDAWEQIISVAKNRARNK